MNFGIENKVALVLAAGGGLGRAIAATLAAEGVKIAITDVDAKALQETADVILSAGHHVEAIAANMSDLAALDNVVAATRKRFGDIDILVNNTGGPPPTTAANVSADLWTTHFNAMVMSVVHMTDLVLPAMKARKWGRIVTSASSGVVAPIPNLGLSNALRSTLVGWSKTLAREVASDCITANIVLPGRIATARIKQLDVAKAAREGKSPADVALESSQSIPMRRYGDPQEYADVVTFLASQRASYVTGSIIRVDGGMLANI